MGLWIEAGFDPDAFWRQTPRLYDIAIQAKTRAADAQHRQDAWLALTTAALVRRDRKAPWPTLEQLTAKPKAARKQTPEEMKAAFASVRAAFQA